MCILSNKAKTCPSELLSKELATIGVAKQGDCVDCTLCVQVCPTGIDIRNGTQLECINCTACMDACDEVMVKIGKPEGLIRVDSAKGITQQRKSIWTKRVGAYSLVLLALLSLESFLFITRTEIETLMLRTPGMLYQDTEDGYISNLYNYQLINKTKNELNIKFEAINIDGAIFEPVGKHPVTKINGITEGAIFLKIPKSSLQNLKSKVKINVYGNDILLEQIETSFMAPTNKKK